jgi:hypothetical protein
VHLQSIRSTRCRLWKGGCGFPSRAASSLHGIDVTCNSPEAVALYDTAVNEYLALTGDPVGHLEAALKLDPGFVMGHALIALLYQLSTGVGRENSVVLRMRRRAQILAESGRCNHRERAMVAAMTSWAEGRMREACSIWEAWLLEQPVDALVIRLLHDSYFFLGDSQQLRDSVGRGLGGWEAG